MTVQGELDELERIANFSVVSSRAPYVPILRLRAGEVAAIFNLQPRVASEICPLFTVPPPLTAGATSLEFELPSGGALQSARELLRSLCPNANFLFPGPVSNVWLDCWPLDSALNVSTFSRFTSDASIDGSKVIPVACIEQSSDHFSAVRKHHKQYASGMMLRMGWKFDTDQAIAISRQCDVAVEMTDLLIDFGLLTGERLLTAGYLVTNALAASVKTPWRSIAVAAGSIKEPFTFRNSERGVPRSELDIWHTVASIDPLIRLGDYTTIAPQFLSGRPRTPLPSLRYTGWQETFIIRRGKNPVSNHQVYREMCVTARSWSQFDVTCTDWGTRQIDMCAGGSSSPTRRRFWTAVGVCHHIELASRQIRKGF